MAWKDILSVSNRAKALLLVFALATSLALNLVLVREALRLNRARILLSLDPARSTAFERENRTLGPPLPARPRLVFFGDSRIADWTRLPEVGSMELINRGRVGDTTAMAMARLQKDVLDLDPAIVVLEVGVNDLKAIAFIPRLAREIFDSATRNMAAMVGELRKNGVEVVVLSVWPRGPTRLMVLPLPWPDVDRAIEEFNSGLANLEGEGVIVVDCRPVLGMEGRLEPRYSRDMLHLNEEGYDRLNSHLRRLLEPIVERISSMHSGGRSEIGRPGEEIHQAAVVEVLVSLQLDEPPVCREGSHPQGSIVHGTGKRSSEIGGIPPTEQNPCLAVRDPGLVRPDARDDGEQPGRHRFKEGRARSVARRRRDVNLRGSQEVRHPIVIDPRDETNDVLRTQFLGLGAALFE